MNILKKNVNIYFWKVKVFNGEIRCIFISMSICF